MQFLDPHHPFFARAWVRWLTVGVALGMAALEFWNRSPFWGLLFGALGGYAAWQLFVVRQR
jgi:hypothetical protein